MERDELLALIDRAAREEWTELNLYKQEITELPPQISQLTNLSSLSLGFNQLRSLPIEIGRLVNLQSLDLNNNLLTSLPQSIEKLSRLERLYLRNNHFNSLPLEVTRLFALQRLDLRYNELASLPAEIGNLVHLRWLYLSDNHLTSIPSELLQLTELQTLDLNDNPDLPLPPEILRRQKSPKDIIRVYLDSLGEQKHPLNEVKLVLVGEGSVGKTSLVNRLLYDAFDPQSSKTEGIAIHRWRLPCHLPTKQSQIIDRSQLDEIRVNVWDFGGQEIMHATHQFFLTKRTVYILVQDSRLSLFFAPYQLNRRDRHTIKLRTRAVFWGAEPPQGATWSRLSAPAGASGNRGAAVLCLRHTTPSPPLRA